MQLGWENTIGAKDAGLGFFAGPLRRVHPVRSLTTMAVDASEVMSARFPAWKMSIGIVIVSKAFPLRSRVSETTSDASGRYLPRIITATATPTAGEAGNNLQNLKILFGRLFIMPVCTLIAIGALVTQVMDIAHLHLANTVNLSLVKPGLWVKALSIAITRNFLFRKRHRGNLFSGRRGRR
jgi:hypothetical protein